MYKHEIFKHTKELTDFLNENKVQKEDIVKVEFTPQGLIILVYYARKIEL